MTYKDKVKLFNARRYLMPFTPEGTKNWIIQVIPFSEDL
jgi:hypothetical protein